ncbi:flagellar hook-length control protein FliK [Aidingimonas halophila]|uniref:Flagellar hook-length control protein FliK n=1 Tax=Aidingimonas halophila TaxID=574349 RepID=A0A1H3B9D7_9GAMM|nr:flagellar hook-length control protein FliK [Aidingimonas halophila]GHC26148.1 flagellar hook-length control protein [Aidingimonas halophila]SDX38640.1 flagellar hook-length control protein FliK [Aidingimonas halophila]
MDITTLLAATGKPSASASGQSRDAGGDMDAFARQLEHVSRQREGKAGDEVDMPLATQVDGDKGASLSLTQIMQQLADPDGLSDDTIDSLADKLATLLDADQLGPDAFVKKLNDDALLDEGMPLGDLMIEQGIDLDKLSNDEAFAAIQQQLSQIDDAGQLNQIAASIADTGVFGRNAQATVEGQPSPSPTRLTGDGLANASSQNGNGNQSQLLSQELLTSRHALAQAQLSQQPNTQASAMTVMTQSGQGEAEALWKDVGLRDNPLLSKGDDSPRHADLQAGLTSLSSPAQGMTSGATSTSATAMPTPTLTQPISSQAWQQQLGQQMINMSRQGDQQVDLKLNPPELGPLSVSLKVGDQGAQAQFLSSHAQVRQAVEQAIPQLREALEEQGISLGEAMVGEHPQGQQQQAGFSDEGSGNRVAIPGGSSGSVLDEQQTGLIPASTDINTSLNGRVDLYA